MHNRLKTKSHLSHKNALHAGKKLGLWEILVKIYPAILQSLVYGNSIIVISLLVWIAFFAEVIDITLMLFGTVLFFFTVRCIVGMLGKHDLKPLKKSKKYLTIAIYTDKAIKILGSALVIFLFILTFFYPSITIARQFFSFFNEIEQSSNVVAITLFLLICFLIIFIFLYDFILRRTSTIHSENIRSLIIAVPMVIFFAAYFAIAFILINSYDSIIQWTFGFSLLGLHGYFLFNELVAGIKHMVLYGYGKKSVNTR